MSELVLRPVATIRSCYLERFGIPRQAGLAPSATAEIQVHPEFAEGIRGIEQFSHLWVIFVFHGNPATGGKRTPLLVRPPRLGGDKAVGVFASRSPFRPNPIGLSAVRLERVEGTVLHVSGGDFLDGTPVLDIKPYVPYADAVTDATGAWAGHAPPRSEVRFSPEAQKACEGYPKLRTLIKESLGADPRTAHDRKRARAGDFACRMSTPESGEVDVHWVVDEDGSALVTRIEGSIS